MTADVVAVRARISEETPRDLRGVDLLCERATQRWAISPTIIVGRDGPFGRTSWQDDLTASRPVLRRLGEKVGRSLMQQNACLTFASDCSVALGTFPALAAIPPTPRVLWLDAHSDYDTPATTTIGFLGCMSLAGATGAWDSGLGDRLAPERVVLAGVRGSRDEFDGAGRAAADASPITLFPPSATIEQEVLDALGGDPVYIHFDPDVLDPSENPVPYARPDGLLIEQVLSILRNVAARGPVLGIELTAFHTDDDEAGRNELAERLLDAVGSALDFAARQP